MVTYCNHNWNQGQLRSEGFKGSRGKRQKSEDRELEKAEGRRKKTEGRRKKTEGWRVRGLAKHPHFQTSNPLKIHI